MNLESLKHWQNVYQAKKPNEVSWHQESSSQSLDLIKKTIGNDHSIIDVGGGASILVKQLFDEDFKDLTVIDISDQALNYAQEQLGNDACKINWICADITEHEFTRKYDFWHDRAVFHFLTKEADREKYKQGLNKALAPGAYLLLATFALDGPDKCSGLEVERYDAEKLQNELANNFVLLQSINETHVTPWGSEQKFIYCLFKKQPVS